MIKKKMKNFEKKINKSENEDNKNVSFIKDSFFQYNRIDPNKNFDNFIIGSSNKLAFEASKKVSEDPFSLQSIIFVWRSWYGKNSFT